MYLADYGNSRIVVMDRKSLTVLYQFGCVALPRAIFRAFTIWPSIRRATLRWPK